MGDRLEEALSFIRDELKPEYREFLAEVLGVLDEVSYYDYTDFQEWVEDYTEDGCEAYIREIFKKYIR